MCLYWTFPHEAINGVLKGFASRNSNHQNVGNALMRKHFLIRFMDITLGKEVVPISTKILRQGKVMHLSNPVHQQISERYHVTTPITHNLGVMFKWQKIWPSTLIIFSDESVWMSIDVIHLNNQVFIWARKLEWVCEHPVIHFGKYRPTSTVELLDVRNVLYAGAFCFLRNNDIMKTFENR